VAGGIGFSLDRQEKTLRIFELISLTDRPVRFLLSELIGKSISLWGTEYLEVDVSAYAPRMQLTLLELGFLPVAYIPAMVFHEVERLDGIRMVRIATPVDTEHMQLISACEPLANLILRSFVDREAIPKVVEARRTIALFRDMSEEQVRQIAGRCALRTFQKGDAIIREGEAGDSIFVVLDGKASIGTCAGNTEYGSVLPGESLGEMSLLTRSGHSATAVAKSEVHTAVLPHDELDRLIRARPDIGVIVYRNLAKGLGGKLIRTDRREG
jgi:hypothetical protein